MGASKPPASIWLSTHAMSASRVSAGKRWAQAKWHRQTSPRLWDSLRLYETATVHGLKRSEPARKLEHWRKDFKTNQPSSSSSSVWEVQPSTQSLHPGPMQRFIVLSNLRCLHDRAILTIGARLLYNSLAQGCDVPANFLALDASQLLENYWKSIEINKIYENQSLGRSGHPRLIIPSMKI